MQRTRISRPLLTADEEVEPPCASMATIRPTPRRGRDELVLHNMGLVGRIAGQFVVRWSLSRL